MAGRTGWSACSEQTTSQQRGGASTTWRSRVRRGASATWHCPALLCSGDARACAPVGLCSAACSSQPHYCNLQSASATFVCQGRRVHAPVCRRVAAGGRCAGAQVATADVCIPWPVCGQGGGAQGAAAGRPPARWVLRAGWLGGGSEPAWHACQLLWDVSGGPLLPRCAGPLRCTELATLLLHQSRKPFHLSPQHCPAEEAEAVHRVAWSLHGSGGAAWLASAGAAGLVRCQWITSK